LGSFARSGSFDGSGWGPTALQQGERAMKRAAGLRLVADNRHELAQRRNSCPPIEERRLRPPGAPKPPGRAHGGLGEHLLASIPRRQRRRQLGPKPLEILWVLAEHHRCPRGHPMPQRIPARHRLARGGPGAGAFQGIAAVGGDLGDGGHGSLGPMSSHLYPEGVETA
jgi:hypothetical protein